MKIVVIGAGAMGSLFGGYLSAQHEVTLIDTNPDITQAIQRDGLVIHEENASHVFHPAAVTTPANVATPADLVILFVKAMYSSAAMQNASGLIGPETLVLTMQNGAGHESILRQYIDDSQIILGTTQHNASMVSPGEIRHGGAGMTYIGKANGRNEALHLIAEAFTACGFETQVSENVRYMIWEKLMLNASASVLTGILQAKLGFILDDAYAWGLAEKLVREAVAVANADGLSFDADTTLEGIRSRLDQSREGITSIYADLRDGRKTEVDTISGAVVSAAQRAGIPAPTHEAMVAMVHAMENRSHTGGV